MMRTFTIVGFLALAMTAAWGQGFPGSDFPCAHAKGAHRAPVDADGSPLRVVLRDRSTAETDVLHYNLELEVNPTLKTLNASNVMTVQSSVDGLSTFTFQLVQNYNITAVRVNDMPATWTRIDQWNVEVTLNPPQAAGAQFTVYVAYNGAPPNVGYGMFFTNHNGAAEVFTQVEPYYSPLWWPCKDDNTDKATADLAFIVPDTMVVASNGLLQGVTDVGVSQKRFHWRTNYPTAPYLICFAATNFNVHHLTWDYGAGTMPLDFYVYPEYDDPDQQAYLEEVAVMLDVFSDLFGLYPFVNEKYGIYEWGWMGGMEHQTMTGQGYFGGDITPHELAHQWWGDALTCATWNDIWLNEGFATYSAALWYEFQPGGGGTDWLHLIMTYYYYPTQDNQEVYVYDTSDPARIFDGNSTYSKGGWVLHMLRHVVGEEHFWDILATWRATYEGSAATTDDFQHVCEQVVDHEMGWFFRWVYAPKWPRYRLAWQDHVADGQHYVEVFLRQDAINVYTMPIDFGIQTAAGTTIHAVWNDAAREHLLIPIGPLPATAVQFDPQPWFLHDEPTALTFAEGPPKIVTLSPAPDAVVTGTGPTQLTVGFHKDVGIGANDFQLVGRQQGLVPLDVTYDSARYVAILTPAGPLAPDWYTLTVFDSVVDVASSQALDGELTKEWFPEPLPSGNGQAGGDAVSWFVVVAADAGDLNCDGAIGSGDVDAFVLALISGEAAYGLAYPDCNYLAADLNGDALVNFADINAFVALLTQ